MASEFVQLERGVIDSMLRDQRFLNAFPFLKDLSRAKAKPKKCGACGNKRRNNQTDYEKIKRWAANLPQEKKAKLKSLLGTKQVRITYTRPEDNTRIKKQF